MYKLRLGHPKKTKKLKYCARSKSLSPSISDMWSSYKTSNLNTSDMWSSNKTSKHSRSMVKVLCFFSEPYVT